MQSAPPKELTPIRLRPEIAPLFAGVSEIQPPLHERTPREVREIMDGGQLQGTLTRPDGLIVQDLMADLDGRQLRLRLYKVKGAEGPLPVVMFIHGGGWVLGNLDTHDRYVCFLTQASGVAFLSVDYRLAPEHPYPACIDDAFDTLRWVHARAASLGLDPDRIGLCGDSAGGQIAAACTLLARERGGPKIAFQSLVYPLTDCDFSRPSYQSWTGLVLTPPFMKWFWRHWYGDALPVDNVLATPLKADMAGLPPAYVVTCEFDILRDEGELYAHKLMDARVPTTLRRVPGVTHPFFRAMDVSSFVRGEMRELGHQIRRHLVPVE